MQYVICYDIADDHRRGRLAQALLDFGARIQESIFVATLDEELKERMLSRVHKMLEPSEDKLHVFPLCFTCAAKTLVLGQAEMVRDEDFYVV